MVSLAPTVNSHSLRRAPGGLSLNLNLDLSLSLSPSQEFSMPPSTVLQIHHLSRTVRLHNSLHDTDIPEPLLTRD